MTFGLIYVVRNSRLGETVFKIGKTTRSIEERVRELNSPTSNLGHFDVIAFFPVSDIDAAEAACHTALSIFREQANREFFSGQAVEIVETVKAIAGKYAPVDFVTDAIKSDEVSPATRSLSQRLLQRERGRQEKLLTASAVRASQEKRSTELIATARELLRNKTDDPRVEISILETSSVLDCNNFCVSFFEDIPSRLRNGLVVPVAAAKVQSAPVLELFVLALNFSDEAERDLLEAGKVLRGNFGLATVLAASSAVAFHSLVRAATDGRWYFGNENFGVSWPSSNASVAADQFIETVADCLSVDLTPQISYSYSCCFRCWSGHVPTAICPQCGKMAEAFFSEAYEEYCAN